MWLRTHDIVAIRMMSGLWEVRMTLRSRTHVVRVGERWRGVMSWSLPMDFLFLAFEKVRTSKVFLKSCFTCRTITIDWFGCAGTLDSVGFRPLLPGTSGLSTMSSLGVAVTTPALAMDTAVRSLAVVFTAIVMPVSQEQSRKVLAAVFKTSVQFQSLCLLEHISCYACSSWRDFRNSYDDVSLALTSFPLIIN